MSSWYLYLLTEDDFDDQVFLNLLEMLTTQSYEPISRRLRRHGGIGEVRKKLPLLLKTIRHAGQQDNVAFVVAIDNDRAPEHSSHDINPFTDAKKECRECSLETIIAEELQHGWPIAGAIAVPVQMIETWLLLMHEKDKTEADLPPFSSRTKPAAKRFYGGARGTRAAQRLV